MTVKLTSNFFQNARGLTLKDSASVTWALNANTNELSATTAGGGLTSVGLSDSSGTPIYTVGNSPLVANGTLTLTLNTQAQKTFFAGPTSGANAQPTFRGLAVADLPTGIPNANLANSSVTVTAGTGLSGGGAVALGAAVTLSLTSPVTAILGGTGQTVYAVGDLLYADTTTTLAKRADVAAGSYLRSGGVSTAPVWSTVTLPNTATQGDLWYASAANVMTALADVAAGSYLRSGGVGANPVWSTVTVPNAAVLGDLWYGSAASAVSALAGTISATKQFLTQTGNGSISAAPAWGTIATGDLPANGANPTAKVGTAAANGTAMTWMRSDGAPPIDLALVPVWTGVHTWNASTSGFGGAASGYVVTPNYWFQQAGTVNVGIRDTTDSVELLLRSDSAGTIIGATTAHQLAVRTNNANRIVVSGTGTVAIQAPTSGAFALSLPAGTTTTAPLVYTSGTSLTTAAAGATEYDGTCFYGSPAASSRAVALTEYVEVMSGTKTLVSQTAAQALLNGTTNGAVTLPIGTYEFECLFSLTALSATAGSSFGFALGGTATFTQAWWALADKATLATATAPQMTFDTAANTSLATGTATTTGYAQITGIIRVTVAGTVIPQISQTTAAAAVVGANSFARFRVVGSATVQSVGNWS